MKAVRLIAATLFVLLLVPASGQAALREMHWQFFTDSALDNLVGETTDYCDDSEDSWGNLTADYVAHYDVSCSTFEVSNVSCAHWTGSAYVPFDCYWDASRVRITIGQQ